MTPAPNKTRARREASKNLGIAMQYRLKNLKDAQGDCRRFHRTRRAVQR